MDKKWHYTEKGEYPEVFGEYKEESYPQIPCLVELRGGYGVRYWNPQCDLQQYLRKRHMKNKKLSSAAKQL